MQKGEKALEDCLYVAKAIGKNDIGGASLDFFEEESLPLDHPLRRCDHTIQTSHVDWL